MPERYEAVDLDAIDHSPIEVSITPFPSLLVTMLDALDEPIHRSSATWRNAVRSRLRQRDLAALLPLLGARGSPDYSCLPAAAQTAVLEDELERIDADFASGAVDGLATVNSRRRVAGNRFRMESDLGRTLDPASRPAMGVLVRDSDLGGLVLFGYSLQPLGRLASGSLVPEITSLRALLGAPRTMLLQRLDRPATISVLARALPAVPSAATHHVRVLERAGLVRRERRGRQVLVWRTHRGTALLELYAC